VIPRPVPRSPRTPRSPGSRRTFRTVAAAVLAATSLALTACGAVTSGTSTGAEEDSSLVIGISRKLTSIDPAQGGSLDGDATLARAIYSGLTYYDPELELRGELAESWTQDDDTHWTFVLRDGVTWSDGSPFTAEQVVWNFQRFLDPESTLGNAAAIRAIISGVTAPDEGTVVIETNGPFIDLPDRLAHFFLVNPDFVQAHPDELVALGTGPYVLESVDLENGAVLTRNPGYFGEAPEWERVEYRVLETEAARVQAAQAEEIDVAIQYEPASLELFAGSDVYDTGNQWSSWNNTLRINENVAPLDDVRVRQALNYAIDKEALIRDVVGADVEPLAGQVLSAPYDRINPDLAAYPYDPERARQLLAEAGHADGVTIELGLSTGSYVAQDPVSQAIARQLGEVGITVEITNQSFPNWVERTRSAEDAPALYYIGYTAGYRAPAERLRIYTSGNGQSHYAEPDAVYDDLVTQVTAATTPEQQQELVNRATAHYREQAHAVFLWPQPLTYVVRKDLEWTPRPEHWLVPQEFRSRS